MSLSAISKLRYVLMPAARDINRVCPARPFPGFGAHQFYLRNKGRAFAFIFCAPLGTLLMLSGIAAIFAPPELRVVVVSATSALGVLLLIVSGTMLLGDIFTLSDQVTKAILGIEREIILSIGFTEKDAA